jgi:hypothetical protein
MPTDHTARGMGRGFLQGLGREKGAGGSVRAACRFLEVLRRLIHVTPPSGPGTTSEALEAEEAGGYRLLQSARARRDLPMPKDGLKVLRCPKPITT